MRPLALVVAGTLACSPAADRAGRPDADERPVTGTHHTPPMIPFEDVVAHPRPGLAVPVHFSFAPDSGRILYLHDPDRGLERRLFAFDPATGTTTPRALPPVTVRDEDLPPEEQLRRERMRERGRGITRYTFARHADILLVPVAGAVYVARGDGPLTRRFAPDFGPIQDPQLSPDGTRIAFVLDDELWVADTFEGEPKRLTDGARARGVTFGLAEYVAQEEMDRHHGFWWSHDGSYLAYTEVDEAAIPPYRIPHPAADRPEEEVHRYPFAGGPNARVRLFVVPAGGGRPVEMDLRLDGVATRPDGTQDTYLARVHPLPNGRLLAEVETRRQDRLDVLELDPTTGRARRLWQETSEVWINLHHLFHAIERGPHAGRFLWGAERDGFMHLYLLEADGTTIRQLTKGPWVVDGLAAVDEARGVAYVTGNEGDPRQRHLFAVPLDGGPMRRLTPESGTHTVVVDRHRFETFVDTHSAIDRPPVTTLRRLSDGAVVATLFDEPDPRVERFSLVPPQFLEIPAPDGTTLYAAHYRPDGPPPYPTVVSVYGGPHVQRVRNAWDMTADLRAQRLRARGFAVLVVDNRGSARRGLSFEGAIRGNMGDLEVRDQAHTVRHLAEQGLVAGETAAIYGWSYGGYMAAMALAKAPEVFTAAVAGAPVTSWDGYDTHYTERYMGLPSENPEGYRRSSVLEHAGSIRGALLLVHGMIDENVHFRHTARLMQRLIDAKTPFDDLLFPSERHMPRRLEDRIYMERVVHDFLERSFR